MRFCKHSCSFLLDLAMVSRGPTDETRMHLGSKPGQASVLRYLYQLPNKVEVTTWRSPWKERGSMWQVTWNESGDHILTLLCSLLSTKEMCSLLELSSSGILVGISWGLWPINGRGCRAHNKGVSSLGEICKNFVTNESGRLLLAVSYRTEARRGCR